MTLGAWRVDQAYMTAAAHGARTEELARGLDGLELELYVSLDGLVVRATTLREQAVRAGAVSLAARADLVRSDALSRGGQLAEALALQQAISADATERADDAILARAGCYLASTYWRLGMLAECVAAAETGVRLLSGAGPGHWPAEHYMVLALFTTYDRVGHVDYALFDEALRRARDHGDARLVLAVLNNYAYTAAERPDGLALGVRLADEMEALIDRERDQVSLATLDTIAWVRFRAGEADRAEELWKRALAASSAVEPDDVAAVQTHLAAVARSRGELDEAAALLEQARAHALAADAPEFAAKALRELAELDAERGCYERAYRRMARFVDERDAAARADSERRAAVLQAIHGTQLERDRRRHYERLASRDALTGLFNRRQLEAEAPALLERGDLAVALLDIDHFKSINDRYSHAVGDHVLKELGRLLAAAGEALDGGFAVRLGGEEFLLVLPGADERVASAVADELRATVERHRWPHVPPTVRPTVSGGIAGAHRAALELPALLALADRRLYAAKRAGRNRIVAVG